MSMLALGPYRFSLNTSAYQQWQHRSDYRWSETEPLGISPQLQYIGPGNQQLELEGEIYPHYKGGLIQLNDMRKAAQYKQPHTLVDGSGYVLGQWVIKHIEETQTLFLANGTPQKITFRLSLQKYYKLMTATYTTKDGDMIDQICFAHYGHSFGTVEIVLNANPGLAEFGSYLPANISIYLPKLTKTPTIKTIHLWQ